MIVKCKTRNLLKQKIIQSKKNMKAIKKRKYLKNLIKIKVDKSNAKGFKISHRSLLNHLMENH
jgi:hypothetical protein